MGLARVIQRCAGICVLAVGAAPFTAQAALDFSSFTCDNPGEQLATLPNSNDRVMAYAYHNGYLISHDWGTGVMKNYDLENPRQPRQVGGDQTPGNAGHHHYMGVGTIIGFNWAGVNQTDLNDVPNFDRDSIVDGTDKAFMVGDASRGHHSELISFYPYGFGSVPTAYEFDHKPVMTIHDLRLPGNPKVGEIHVQDDLGFQGRVNMVGNLLIIRGDNLTGSGVGVYDISDPANPVLLDKIRDRSYPFGGQWAIGRAYDTMPMYKHYIVNAMNGDTGFQRSVDIIDYSDPTNLRHVSSADYSGPSLRYPNFKDDHMYVGEAKVDMRTFEEVESFPWAYGEYLMPIGNLLVAAGQYRMNTAGVYCNEREPDTRAPEVGWSNPRPNATNLHVKSRVGVMIHEILDINTINEDNFQIRTSTGDVVPADVSWWSNQTINVTPREPLQPNATYQFFMRADGVKDVAGNGLAEDYSFYFSTGNQISSNEAPVINAVNVSSASVVAGDSVTLSIDASDDGDALTYDIDWGDDNVDRGLSNPEASHTYAASGIYFVNVEVFDANGGKSTKVVRIVVEAANVTRHLSSSTIVFDSNNNRVLNVNPDNNTITAINASTGEKLFESAVGKDPRGIALDGAGNIWVTNHDDGTVSVLNSNGSLLKTIALHPGSKPVSILIAPNQLAGYVSAQGSGVIYKLNVANQSLVGALNVGAYPYAMAMTADSQTLLATRFISPQNEAQVYRVRTSDFTKEATIKITADTTSLDTSTSARGVVNYLMGIAIEPGTNIAWITGKKDNVFRGMALDGNFGNFQNSVRSVIAKIDLTTNTEVPNSKFDIDNAEIASAIAFSRGGEIAYVANQGNNRLSAYDVSTMQGIDLINMGLAPKGITVADNGDVFTHNFLSRSVSRLTLYTGSGGSLSAFDELSNTVTVSNELLPEVVLKGKRLFYDTSDTRIAMDGYLACATCHTDGGSDHRVYDFTDRGEGLRNTISLRGRAGTGHGRVHWSANFDEIQDFEHDIRFAFLGSGLIDNDDFANANTTLGNPKAGLSEDLDALATYVTSLDSFVFSPHRNADGSLTSAAQAGKTIFQNKGCADCHGGEAFTDSANGNRHDVGTTTLDSGLRLHGVLNGFDTPTLRGVWDTAPYLHDGSAATLADVLNNAAHGDSASLNSSERDQLVAYLLQIDGEEPAAAPIANAVTVTSLNFGQTVTTSNIPLTLNTTLTGIQEVQWVVNDMPLASVSNAPYSTTWAAQNVTPGLQRVYARVVYNNGLTATLSPEVTINYQPSDVPAEPVKPTAPLSVELRVEIESYSNYHDTSSGNTGGSNTASCNEGLGTDVDIHSEGNICAVGWVNTGEWLDYIIDVPQAGEYEVSFRYSNGNSSPGTVEVRTQSGSTVETSTALSNTGGWGNYQTYSENSQRVTLAKGIQTIRMYVLNEGFNLDYFDLKAEFDGDSAGDESGDNEIVSSASSESSSSVVSSSSSSVGSSSSIAQSNTASGFKVQAEDYTNASDTTPENKSNPNNACVYRGFGVDVSGTGDSGGGCHVGWTSNGEWLDYVIDVQQAGQYKLTYRYASGHTGSVGAIQFKNAAGTTLNRLPVEGKGVWGQFHDLTTTVNLEAGQQTIRLYLENAGFDLNWFEFEFMGAGPIVSLYQAEDYINASDANSENKGTPNNACAYKGFGVDVTATGDSGGGCHVGWSSNGEWLDYAIDIPQAGEYRLTYRYASGHNGSVGAVQFKNAAGTTLNRLPVEGRGVWGQFHDLTTTVNLEAGQQTIRLYLENPGFDLNWFKLEYVGGSAPEAEPPTDSNVGNTCGASASDVITMTTATFAKVVEGSCLKYTVNNNTLRFGSWGGHVINFDVMGGETNVTHNIQGWIALGQPRGDVYIKINSLSVDTLSVMLEQW